MRALGVTTPQCSPVLPDVPAIGETLKGFDIVLYSGVMGPAGIQKLGKLVRTAGAKID